MEVGILTRERLHRLGTDVPEHDRGAVWRIAQGAGQHHLAPGLGRPDPLEMSFAMRTASLDDVLDVVVEKDVMVGHVGYAD